MSYIGTTEIGKMFLGTTEIDKAYLGSTLVFTSGGQVTSIPYIRNTGVDAYINTGITPDQTTRVIVWARNLNPYAFAWLFGSRVSGTSNGFTVCAPNAGGIGKIRLQFGRNTADLNNGVQYLGGYHKYELNDGALYVDDVKMASVTASTFSNSHAIHLFGMNNNGIHATASVVMDICAAKIYKGGSLVRDFKAVNSPSVGLYDSVSQSVFTNAGSGSFTYGTFMPDAYTPLEYIQCTGAQWFNTGIYGSNNLSVFIQLMIEGTTATYSIPFGTMISNQSGSYYNLQFSNSTAPNRYCNFYINTTTAQQVYNNNNSRLTSRKIVFWASSTQAGLTENNATIGTNKSYSVGTFTTPHTIYLGTTNLAGSPSLYDANMFRGRIYHFCMGPYRNFVPAKVNGVAGMYDTYNDVFYTSATSTNFVAGTEL